MFYPSPWHLPQTAEAIININTTMCLSLSILLNQFRNERRPAGLVAGADAGAVVAVKVFVKRNEVAPVRILLKFLRAAEDRTTAMFILQKYSREPLRDFTGDLPEVQADRPSRWETRLCNYRRERSEIFAATR